MAAANEQLTVGMLMKRLAAACKKDPTIVNKRIITGDDIEGNGYHGLWFDITSDPEEVKECIEASNGLSESETNDPTQLVIIG